MRDTPVIQLPEMGNSMWGVWENRMTVVWVRQEGGPIQLRYFTSNKG